MKIIVKRFMVRVNKKVYGPNSVIDIDDAMAKKLIARSEAAAISAPIEVKKVDDVDAGQPNTTDATSAADTETKSGKQAKKTGKNQAADKSAETDADLGAVDPAAIVK